MIDERELLERELERLTPDPGMFERVERRRERKVRRQRIAAGVLGISIAVAVTVAAVNVLNDQGSDKNQTNPTPTVTPTPSPVTELPEPMVELPPGYWFVDVGTGEATRVPENITSIRGANNFDVSPDGSMILFDNSAITRPHTDAVRLGYHQLYIANIDGSGLRQLTNDPVGASRGRWSPDGTKVVYLGGWGKLCCWRWPADLTVLDLTTGATDRLAHGRAQDLYDPSFAPDGGSILFTNNPGSSGDPRREDLWTISVNGGSPRLLLDDRGGEARFSPDGTTISYLWIETLSGHNCFHGYGVGWISDADGSDPRPIDPDATAAERSSGLIQWSPDGARIIYSGRLIPPKPGHCSWPSDTRGVFVLGVRTGERTLVTFGWAVDWVDEHTVLVRAQRGVQPS